MGGMDSSEVDLHLLGLVGLAADNSMMGQDDTLDSLLSRLGPVGADDWAHNQP